jgi:hypothetical protein
MGGTKQIRLSDPLAIRQQVRNYLGKKINIVLSDNRVIIGELKEVNDVGIRIMNMRLKNMAYPFREVSEIYFDTFV